MKHLLEQNSLTSQVTVSSSATSGEEITCGVGNPMYPPAKAELRRHGVPFEEREATRLILSDYEKYDLFIGMDDRNVHNMLRIFNGDPKNKIRKLMDYTITPKDVSDPWYSDRFDIAYNDIYSGCKALLEQITGK